MKKASNIRTWNYPSKGTPIYRDTTEIPPMNSFRAGGYMGEDPPVKDYSTIPGVNKEKLAQWNSLGKEAPTNVQEAQLLAEAVGYNPQQAVIVAAQWALESGQGKKTGGDYNYFGIKSHNQSVRDRMKNAYGIDTSAAEEVATSEYEGGKKKSTKASFLNFQNPIEAFLGHKAFLETNARYKKALEKTSPAEFVEALGEAGYATDVNYKNKIASIAKPLIGEEAFGTFSTTSSKELDKYKPKYFTNNSIPAAKSDPEEIKRIIEKTDREVSGASTYQPEQFVELESKKNIPIMSLTPGKPAFGQSIFTAGQTFNPPKMATQSNKKAYGGNINLFQNGGGDPPTAADSLAVANSAKEVANYYTNKNYSLDSAWEKVADDETARSLYRDRLDPFWLKTKKETYNERLKELKDYPVPKGSKGYYDFKYRTGPKEEQFIPYEDYFKQINNHQYKKREEKNLILDTRSPMPLYDTRIYPSGQVFLINENRKDPYFNDQVTFPVYDPLAVTPWNMLSEDDKKLRLEIYGSKGTPVKGYVPIKSKIENRLKELYKTNSQQKKEPNLNTDLSAWLKTQGASASYADRKKLYEQTTGQTDYKGTAKQNIGLLNLVKEKGLDYKINNLEKVPSNTSDETAFVKSLSKMPERSEESVETPITPLPVKEEPKGLTRQVPKTQWKQLPNGTWYRDTKAGNKATVESVNNYKNGGGDPPPNFFNFDPTPEYVGYQGRVPVAESTKVANTYKPTQQEIKATKEYSKKVGDLAQDIKKESNVSQKVAMQQAEQILEANSRIQPEAKAYANTKEAQERDAYVFDERMNARDYFRYPLQFLSGNLPTQEERIQDRIRITDPRTSRLDKFMGTVGEAGSLAPEALLNTGIGLAFAPANLSKLGMVADAVSPIGNPFHPDFIKSINKAGDYLTTQTPLKNAYKLNPRAPKLGQYNRVVGQDAIDDIIESGLVRVNENAGVATDLGPFGIVNRTTPYPSFGKANPQQKYIDQVISQGKTPYVISTDRPMRASTLARHGKGKTQFPINDEGKYISGFPASEAQVYEATPHWLRGYKPIETPTSPFNTRAQNDILLEQARRSGEAPLPSYMEPYISRRYTPASKEQDIFESFLSPEKQAELRKSRTQTFTPEGVNTPKQLPGSGVASSVDDVAKEKASFLGKPLQNLKNNQKIVLDHVAGLTEGIIDPLRYPLTFSRKAKLIREQDEALKKAVNFTEDWYFNSDGSINNSVKKRMKDLSEDIKTKEVLDSYNRHTVSVDNPMEKPNKLASSRTKDLKTANISDYDKKYITKNRGRIAGVNTRDNSITLRNSGNYYMKPEKIAGTIVHENAHSAQKLGEAYDWDTHKWSKSWGEGATKYDEYYDYFTSDKSTEAGKEFAKHMVAPKRKGSSYSYQTWKSSPNELHADLMTARYNLVEKLSKNQTKEFRDNIINRLRDNPTDADIDLLLKDGLNKFFKRSTSKENKRKIIRMLPALLPAAMATGAAASSNEYQQGGNLNTFNYQENMLPLQTITEPQEVELTPEQINYYRSLGYEVEELD